MAEVFPFLYVMENSIRVFLTKALLKYCGNDWWNTHAKSLHNLIAERKKSEAKNAWHQKRSVQNIDYLDMKDLIVLANKVDTRLVTDGILPKRDWLKNIIEEVYESRCVLCHMNPLEDDSIRLIEVQYTKWTNQISAIAHLL